VTASGTGLWYLTSNFNDRAESIAIPSGWSVRVYKDDSETSTSKCYWATDTNMNNDVFNDSSTVGNAVTWARVFSNSDCAFPNQAPSTPTLSSPASGSSHTSTPQLCWNPSTDQDGDSITYQVNAWGPTNYTSSWISGTCLTPTTLPVGNYTWNVRAKDSKGAESGASADWTFSIQSGPPPADHSVQFYKDLHYEQGYCYGDTAAAYPNLDGCSGYDNAISSVILKSGWSVRVYKDRDLGGTSKCYSANDDNFDGDTFDDGTGVNDQVSSFILYNQLNCPNPNHAPTTPTLSNPANGSSHTNTPQLCWNASTDQDGDSITYQVNVWGTTNYTSSWISSTCLTPTTLPLGNYTWNVRAKDSKGAESGASSERTFSIIPGTSPDLIIQSITSNPQTPAIGEQVTFTIRVKNQGSGNISSPFWVDFFIDEQPISDCSDIGMEYWSIDTLSAGATTDRTFIFSGFTTSGNHTLYAFADTNCNVAESQESNNLLGPITLVVLPPGINTSIPKPTLSAPADNALITANEVKLDWVNASLPSSMVFDHYQVQVAADSGFGNIVTDRSINDRVASETLLSGNLTPNNRYYWRVRVYNTLNQYGEWSLIRSFRKAMLPPALIAPAAGTTPNNLRPRFDWQDVSGATSYQIQISKYANMSSPSVSKTVSGSYYDPTADLPVKQTLYWRVRTNGANGPSLWSEVRSFISPNPPGRPSLQSPADNALTRDYTPRLDWSTSSLPSGTVFSYYHLQVARDSGFTNMALDTNISGQSNSEYTFTANLAANTKYYWRVMAVNTQGQYRSWSSVRSFRTAILPPSLITPANNGTLNTQRPTFDWGDISGASNYQIQISKYSNMKYPLIDVNISASNYLATKNLPTGRNLYWRVRAKGTNGPSDWSAIQSFMINIP
jgi:fibronectin type 3 domain-containing protein